ncbi:MAG: ribonuclease P protein component [Bacillota bacterium]|nr:ribonuclease P protein component [Bacillota bacterium]
MLKSHYRLKKGTDFRKVYNKGNSIAGRHMVLYWLNNDNSQYCQAGFSVSKKVGKAVVRNKYKRLLKASLRSYLDKLVGKNIIIIARPRIISADFKQIEGEMKYLLRKAKLIK